MTAPTAWEVEQSARDLKPEDLIYLSDGPRAGDTVLAPGHTGKVCVGLVANQVPRLGGAAPAVLEASGVVAPARVSGGLGRAMMRDSRLMMGGVVCGGFWARFFTAPDTLLAYAVACVTVWGLVELSAFLWRYVRWERGE